MKRGGHVDDSVVDAEQASSRQQNGNQLSDMSAGSDGDIGIEMKPLVTEGGEGDHAADNHRNSFAAGLNASVTVANGTASNAQVAVNIFISFVGAGLLGQPYAFAQSGWLMGAFAVSTVSAANVYAMLLLVKTRKKLELEECNKGIIRGYGDIGRVVSGLGGERFVNLCLVISQVGFATAYIIFIAANLHSVFNKLGRVWICFGCIPTLSLLVQAQDMKTLSPFSLIADVANLLGLGAVLFQDYEYYEYHHETIQAVTNFKGFIYVASVAIYSLEGVNLVLPLESSCADRKGFPALLMKVIAAITLLMVSFGSAGYVAFGSKVKAPITLNLSPDGPWGNFVKVALSLALYLTYPVMMFPVGQVLEDNFAYFRTCSAPTRAAVVVLTAAVAYAVPSFGKFLGLVGSSICMILGFILPCYFHLKAFGKSELSKSERFFDFFLIAVGSIMGVIGTYNSCTDMLEGHGQ